MDMHKVQKQVKQGKDNRILVCHNHIILRK